MLCASFLKALICLIICLISAKAETTWVWNPNRTPESYNSQSASGSQNVNFGEVNFGRDRDRDRQTSGKATIFPDSPSRPSTSNKGDNFALPADSIRLVNNGNSEARLIPGAANFVSNALQSLGGGGGGGSSGGTGGGLFSIGGNLISSIFQSVPQLTGSALEILLGRPSKGNSASGGSGSSRPSNSNGASTLPASTSGTTFPILTPGGSSFSRPSSNPGNSGNSGQGSSSGSCRCIPSNECFLPNTEGGSCAGGNKLCCASSTRTRSIPDDGGSTKQQNTRDFQPTKSDEITSGQQQQATAGVRLGLLENIVKGGSNVVDDTLDLLLLRWYTPEDQQRLANRVLKSG